MLPTVYVFVVSKLLRQLTTIESSHQVYCIKRHHPVRPKVQGNYCNVVGLSNPNIQCGDMRQLFVRFIPENSIGN